MSSSIAPSSHGSGTAPVPEQASSAEPGAGLVTQDADELAAAAVELARAAAEDVAEPGTVGPHLGVRSEGEGLVLHTFESLARGYRGWVWAVSLAHVAGSDDVTVCDSVLLPGDTAVLAPEWLPWSDRLAPGDLSAGDELPYREDDPLLVAGFTVTDDEDADQIEFWELGLGRVRVLGREGREETATRWYTGEPGPTSEVAIQAPASCLTCGYFIPLSGSMRQLFGVCSNEWSPSDASVVSLDHGCGAHSETDLAPSEPEPIPDPIVDDSVLDVLELEPDPVIEVAPVAAEVAEIVAPDPESLVVVAGVDEPADVVEPGTEVSEVIVVTESETSADPGTPADADPGADAEDLPPAP